MWIEADVVWTFNLLKECHTCVSLPNLCIKRSFRINAELITFEIGHAFFFAANFVALGEQELHGDVNGMNVFWSHWRRISKVNAFNYSRKTYLRCRKKPFHFLLSCCSLPTRNVSIWHTLPLTYLDFIWICHLIYDTEHNEWHSIPLLLAILFIAYAKVSSMHVLQVVSVSFMCAHI